MKIAILPLAEADFDKIHIFYLEKNHTVAAKICNAILDEMEILEKFPKAGSVEPLLDGLPKIFRSLVVCNGLFKVIYFLEGEIIYVTHIWCCRQSPKELKSRY